MRKYKNIKPLQILLLALFVIASSIFVTPHAHAQNLSTNVNLDWIDGSSSCYGTANGQAQAYYGAVSGDNITLHVTNVSSTYRISVDISESGQSTYSTSLSPGSSVSPNTKPHT